MHVRFPLVGYSQSVTDDEQKVTRPRRADAMQRAAQAWHLRVIGRTWEEIAREVGYASPQGAHRAVSRFAVTLPDPKPDELREMWRARMEKLWTFAVRDAEAGRPGALRAGVAIADRAGKLDGLDAPVRFEVTPDEMALQGLVEELLSRGGQVAPIEAEVIDLEVLPAD